MYQTMNNGASFMIFSALLAGIYKLLGDADISWKLLSTNADSVFLAIFIIFFRVKMHMDDHEYFEHFKKELNKYKYLGLIFALTIWFLMAFSGYYLRYPETSCHLLALAFGFSTIWIVLHLMEISRENTDSIANRFIRNLRHRWIIINVSYIILLELYAQESDILFTFRGNIAMHFDLAKWGFIVLMLIVMATDHLVSVKKGVES
jgi:hypothetical protein